MDLEVLVKVAMYGYKELSVSEIDLLKKYLFDKDLGIDNIQLSKLDLKIITHIIKDFEDKNETIENNWINILEFKNKLNITDSDFDNFIYKIKDKGLSHSPSMGNGCSFSLDYSLFWKTNYWEKTENSLYFIDLIIRFIKLLKTNYNLSDNYIDITKLTKLDTEEQLFTYTQINTILSYCNQQCLFKSSNHRGDLRFIFREVLLDKGNFTKIKRILNMEENY